MTSSTASPLGLALSTAPVLGIVRTHSVEAATLIAGALEAGGLGALEVSLTSHDALSAIAVVRDALDPATLVGAGTVRTGQDAERAIEAGARFLVSPNLSAGVVSCARAAGVPLVCGVLTPTEVQLALDDGLEWLKVFPASAFGPRYIRELTAPFPGVAFVPTGGVTIPEIAEYRRSGAAAVGLGGALAGADQVRDGDAPAIAATVRSALDAWKDGAR